MSTCSECRKVKDHPDGSASPEEQKDDAGILSLFDFVHRDDMTSGQYDPMIGGIVNGATNSWDFEEYPFCIESEGLQD